MARPRKPTHLHIVQGTLTAARRRARRGEPIVSDPIGPAPDGVDKVIWDEIVAAIPAGVAGAPDRLITELATRLVRQMRAGPVSPALAAQVRGCLQSLGLTPGDRSRVTAQAAERVLSDGDPASRYFT